MFAQETLQYLADPTSWFNMGFAVQAVLVLMIVVGGLIALPDHRTNRIMAQDNLGRFLFVIGLGFTILFVVPAVLPGLLSMSWLSIVFILVIVLLLVVRRFSR
jgi:hypothetical protein